MTAGRKGDPSTADPEEISGCKSSESMDLEPEEVSGGMSITRVDNGRPHTGVGSREGPELATAPHHPDAHPPGPTPPAPHRDWREMTRHDFDPDAPAPALFELEPAAVTAVDPCGTGDLLELLTEEV